MKRAERSASAPASSLSLKRTLFEAWRGLDFAAAKSGESEGSLGSVRVGEAAAAVEEENWEESSLSWVRRRGSWDVMDLEGSAHRLRGRLAVCRACVLVGGVLDLRLQRLDAGAQLLQ